MKILRKIISILLFLLLALPIFAQVPTELDETYLSETSQLEFFYPSTWTMEEFNTDGSSFTLYEADFDRTSGQQPRGVVLNVTTREKTDQNSGDGTLEEAFLAQADPPAEGNWELYPVENSKVPMLRGDTTMVGNVALSIVLVDASEDTWAYLHIMNADKAMTDTVLQNIASVIAGQEPMIEFPEGLEAVYASEWFQSKFFYPETWILDVITDDGSRFDLYQNNMDIDSTEAPRAVIVEVSTRLKTDVNMGDGTLLDAFSISLKQPDDADWDLYEVPDTMVPMVRRDTTKGGIPFSIILADVSEEAWLDIRIIHSDNPIVDSILQNITSLMADTGDAYCPTETEDMRLTVVLVSANDRGINVIKAIRNITFLGLAEAKAVVDAAPVGIVLNGVNVTTALDAKTALELEGATVELRDGEAVYDPSLCVEMEMAEGSGLFQVIISEAGTQQINVIKGVRSLTSLGLAEAKDIVGAAPNGIVLSGVNLEQAEAAKLELETVGATVLIEELP